MKALQTLSEDVREMVLNGASANDIADVLRPIYQSVQKQIESSWRENPDRMGGQYTYDEIDREW